MHKKYPSHFKFRDKNIGIGISYNFWHDLPTVFHDHDFYEIFITLEGSTKHWFNDKEYVVPASTVVLIRPGDSHMIYPDSNSPVPAKHFNMPIKPDVFSFLSNVVSNNLLNKITYAKSHIAFKATTVQFNYLKTKIQQLSAKKQKPADCLKILAIICLDVINQSLEETALPAWLSEFVEKTLQPEYFVLPINKLYRLVPYSQPQFCFLFKKYFHTTLTDHITNVRLDYACTLLSNSNFSILKISNLAGFTSISHFNHMFKKYKKISPSAFRKQFTPPRKINLIEKIIALRFYRLLQTSRSHTCDRVFICNNSDVKHTPKHIEY